MFEYRNSMDDTENRKRWATANAYAYCAVENNAVNNRRPMTQAETVLWEELRSNKLGVHFRRQHVIGTYIVDFVSLKNHLVIEVDGEYHFSKEQKQKDKKRDFITSQYHIITLRIKNADVKDDYKVRRLMSKIRDIIEDKKINAHVANYKNKYA